MAIRLLHFSDAHIGVESYGRLDPATGLNSRLHDFTAVLDQVVDRALEGDVDLVLFTGDAYRSRDPNPTHQREFARRIRRLSQADVPVFLLVGNHDLPAMPTRANSVDIFETLAVPNVYVGRVPTTHRLETRHGPLQVVALPWVAPGPLLARESYRELSPEQLGQRLGDVIGGFLQRAIEGLDRELPAVLAAHLVVMGAVYGSERSAALGQELVLPKSAVADPAFDYVALGHIHQRQVVSERQPLAIYAGSLERVDFGEEKERKGYVVVDVERGGAQHQFYDVAARRFLTIRVEAPDEDPTQAALRAIARHAEKEEIAGAVVRLEVATTPEREPQILHVELRRALRDAHHLAGIVKRIERRDRVRLPELGTLTPLEALRVYLRSKQTPAERLDELLERGGRLIAAVTGSPDGGADGRASVSGGRPGDLQRDGGGQPAGAGTGDGAPGGAA